MEFYVKTEEAQRAFKLLGVTAKVNTTDFEGQILIKALPDSVLFLSNNGRSGISCEIPANVTTQGKTTVIYSKMKSFIMTFVPWDGEIGAKEFHFSSESGKLHVATSTIHLNELETNSNLKLDQARGSAFASQVSLDEPTIILNSSIIKSAIEKGLYAIDSNSTIDYIKGLRMCVEKNTIQFTSTNGHVISDYTVTSEGELKDGDHFLSHEFLMGLRRIIVDDAQLFLEFTKTKTVVALDNVVYWSTALHYKEYPQYMSVFEEEEKEIEVDRETLLNGLSSFVDVLDADDHNRVTIEMVGNRLALKTDNSLFEYPGLTEAVEFSLDLDGREMINTLHALGDDSLKLRSLGSTKGMVFESVGYEDHKSYVVSLKPR